MKKVLISLIIVSLLGFNTIALAAEEGSTVDAGITPDSILYSADQLFEDLQLAFTTNSEKEAELLLKFAQERLAEAKEMTEEAKTEFVKTAMDAYIETLDKAEEKVTEVAADESTTEEVVDDLSQQLEDTAIVDEVIEQNLDTEQQEQLKEKTTEVSYTANVVKNLDVELVKALREEGMGFGNIAHTIALSELSGVSVEEISSMIGEGKGIGNIAKELGIHPSKMNKESDVAEEVTDENTTPKEVAEESDENTNDEKETQATTTTGTITTQTISAMTSNQSISKQVQSGSVKAASNKQDNKTPVDTKKEKSNENDATTSIKQEDNITKDNSSGDDEGSSDQISNAVNQNNNEEKIDNNNGEKIKINNNENGKSEKSDKSSKDKN